MPTGPVNRDYDDVRRYYDAACNGMRRYVVWRVHCENLLEKNFEKLVFSMGVSLELLIVI